jgi:hypothetical protein
MGAIQKAKAELGDTGGLSEEAVDNVRQSCIAVINVPRSEYDEEEPQAGEGVGRYMSRLLGNPLHSYLRLHLKKLGTNGTTYWPGLSWNELLVAAQEKAKEDRWAELAASIPCPESDVEDGDSLAKSNSSNAPFTTPSSFKPSIPSSRSTVGT